MPFNPNPINAEQLRESIQLAGATDTIFLADGATYDSVTTLAKIVCGLPTVREYGYTINGSNATVLNSRLFQQNIDGDLPALQYTGGTENLTLSYSSGGASDGGALLRANFAGYTIDGVNFTGQHSGWTGQGNSGLYMSLTTFNYAAPIDVDLTFSNSLINITGQGNLDPTLSSGEGGSAFLHSWNNAGTVTLDTNVFDESGYRSSFNFTNFSAPNPGPPTVGTYNIIGNTFTRTNHIGVVRSEGNRLGNVKATLTNNTFNNGTYLDLYDNVSGVSFAGGENYFTSVAGGYGIRATGPNIGNVTLLDNSSIAFDGIGLALKYVSNDSGSFMLSTSGTTAGMTVNGKGFVVVAAGSQVADTIIRTESTWAYGDNGNDTITSGNGDDYLDGGDDDDVLTSGVGADTLIGGLGNDNLSSGNDADRLEGGAGNDSLNGGAGADRLFGDAGNDTLLGGTGIDTLTGGDGSDQFRWASTPAPGDGTDQITDFIAVASIGVDADQMALIDIFAGTNTNSTLNSNDFATATGIGVMTNANNNNKVTRITNAITNISTTASGANVNGYVLAYNNTTGKGELWYDSNWNNTPGRVQVTTFDNVSSLTTLNAFTNANFFAYL
jgi:Ca2+-binding RTX toxin-like protein